MKPSSGPVALATEGHRRAEAIRAAKAAALGLALGAILLLLARRARRTRR